MMLDNLHTHVIVPDNKSPVENNICFSSSSYYIDSHAFFNLNRVCKIGTPIALRLTYLMPEAASSFYTLLHVGKDANVISIDLTLVRRK